MDTIHCRYSRGACRQQQQALHNSPPLCGTQGWIEGTRWREEQEEERVERWTESVRGGWREGTRKCRGMVGWQHCLYGCFCCNRLTSQLCHLHHVSSYLPGLSLCLSLLIREAARMEREGERGRDRERPAKPCWRKISKSLVDGRVSMLTKGCINMGQSGGCTDSVGLVRCSTWSSFL